MRLRELRQLVGPRRLRLYPRERRLARSYDISDLEATARRQMPRAVFDYVAGGADEELGVEANLAAFRRWRFVPRNLRDVGTVDTSVELLGERIAMPLLFSPTGFTRMLHPAGECAVARAARRAGSPYGLSTVASTSIEELAATGHPNLWFQLYIWRDREPAEDLVARAWHCGYRTLEVSVDVPVAGHRSRDLRHGLTFPPRLTARALLDMARHPGWWMRALRAPVMTFANVPSGVGSAGRTIENMTAQFDPSVSWSDLETLRERWPGRLLLKGTIGAEDARRAVAAGCDGLHLSNHGGRQLDRAAVPIDLLPEVRRAVGEDPTIVVDSGIRHGADLAVAVALGADAGAVGRAYLYGLMAAGEPGVDHAARILATQFQRTLQLLGVASVRELREAGPVVLRG